MRAADCRLDAAGAAERDARPTASCCRRCPMDRCSPRGPNPKLTSYSRDAQRLRSRASPALRLEALPDPSLPKGGPGPRRVRRLPRDRIRGPRRSRRRRRRRRANGRTPGRPIKVDDRRRRSTPPNCSPRHRRPRATAWAIDAMRDSERHAAAGGACGRRRRSASPAARALDADDRSARRHASARASAGSGSSVTSDADPLDGGVESGARLRACVDLPASQRSDAQSEELAAAFRATSPLLEADARRARAAREGARRTRHPVDARHAGTRRASSGRRSSARARQLHGEGRARLRAHAAPRCIRCATT